MKLSEFWLREWVNPDLTINDIANQITMAGLEVDAVEPVASEFSGVVVGEIIAIEQHPDADKLRVCQVAGNGSETLQVVCGAPNARPGIKIPFATVGAILPENVKIKKAKLRGVESFGMLCAQTELQLGEDNDGLWELPADATTGQDLREYLSLNDTCLDIDLTPNRGDCLSVKGVARDIGVLNRLQVTQPNIPVAQVISDESLSITLTEPDMCPRYIGRIIRNVDLSHPTPLWMQERLRRAGVGSKDIVVDTTNYVLLELGQPMHAFDLDKLSGGITVRKARVKEVIALLNGQSVELDDQTLVIADDSAAVAIAGIMGGSETAVGSETRNIFLESAFFSPVAIAGRARSYGLHTDSSHRFERGVDYRLQEQAIERATQLITKIAGGDVSIMTVAEESHELLAERSVTLRRAYIERGLGFAMDDGEVLDILERLGLEKLSGNDQGWTFNIPSYRFDINIEADLLEELARIYGYNRLPTSNLLMSVELPDKTESTLDIRNLLQQLVARDYREAVCYSFVDPKLQQCFDPELTPIALKNPISSDMAVMRTSLWPGLIQALRHNLNRQHTRVRLFETGLRFLLNPGGSLEDLVQEPVVAGLLYGARNDESWLGNDDKVDFYDLKGDIESLLELSGQGDAFGFVASTHPALHSGQTADITYGGRVIGTLGALHPRLQQKFSLPQPVYLFEISQEAILQAKRPIFKELSRFPEVRRDLAVIVDQTVSVADLEAKTLEVAGESLVNLKVFDVYIGKSIDSHRKSVALGLTFQHLSRTLTDKEINTAVERVIDALKTTYEAVLR
ncbi:phenylalanine--tRNA ligase subunit beta [Candidatus Endobugula sertula]|uniref:Phenylalanine--tRNA ligase beta subunit n=1 Tax=Candidatus Endobugula sertula TaxID=62101 RepID=A0A1D2QMG4_9GAMM|nr:phenylalanine--tRNA ligase subunit beta [Candidatus Endobugula sertula]